MIDISLIILGILFLFVLFILLPPALKVCALCASISVTWVTLLALFYIGKSIDPVSIGILMGGSIVGAMYFLERKLPESYQVFKLPFFLTLFSMAYLVLGGFFIFQPFIILIVLWIMVVALKHKGIRKRMIECCKNW